MSTDNKPVKKYRLCKDYVTPRFTFLKDTPVAYIGGNNYVVGLEVFSEKEMQDNTQWFSPIEEELPLTKERIVISGLHECNIAGMNNPHQAYGFTCSIVLPEDKREALNRLIFRFINNEYMVHSDNTFSVHSENQKTFTQKDIDCGVLNSNNEGDGSGIIRVAEAHWKEIHKLLDKYEKEMGAIIEEKVYAGMENVFNAAREKAPVPNEHTDNGYFHKSFQDYKAHINSTDVPENKYLPTDTVPLKSNAIEESGHISSLEKYPSTLPSIDEAGIIAIKISETVNPELTSQEQAFFIAGFQECIKWQLKKESAPKDKVDGKEGRDWEILSVLADDGNPIYYPSRDIIDACLKRNGERIHSVKRNSDQITFTVGDIIEGAQLEAHNTVSHHPTEIKSIRVINGTIGLAYGNGGEVIISHAKKLPESQPKEQVPLFTTEDGVKVMEWDTFYYVPESMEWVNSCCRAMPQPPESFKYFSTKEAAEQYILENKPCLSLNDVKLISNIHGVTEKTQWYEVPLYALKHTIKQIINQ
jgi:hypothetical protein